jgi:hypothetical protein
MLNKSNSLSGLALHLPKPMQLPRQITGLLTPRNYTRELSASNKTLPAIFFWKRQIYDQGNKFRQIIHADYFIFNFLNAIARNI